MTDLKSLGRSQRMLRWSEKCFCLVSQVGQQFLTVFYSENQGGVVLERMKALEAVPTSRTADEQIISSV